MNSIVRNLNYLAFATTGVCILTPLLLRSMEIGEGLDGIEKNDFYICVHSAYPTMLYPFPGQL